MKKIADKIEKFQLGAGIILLTIFLIAVLAQVFSRYIGVTAVWTEEVAMYSFIWATFMGASAMVNQDAHFAFTFLGEKLEGKKGEILKIITKTIMLLFAIGMIWYGIKIVDTFWTYIWISIPQFKMGYTWMCIPISGLTMVIYLVAHIQEHIKNMGLKQKNRRNSKEVV
jgi:TRAP-type C4-dicarboxylate transport system permease small subunit